MDQDELLLSAGDVQQVPWSQQFTNIVLLLFAVMMIAAIITYEKRKANPDNVGASFTLELAGALPAVEPLELKPVAPATAKLINAAVPFSQSSVPSARPFTITGSALDIGRATDCLAAAIFYEAGAETLDGKMAVAQVILNRMRHPAYPHSICGVVYQGSSRQTGCQFSFTCDGSMRRSPSASSWQNARQVAGMMLNGAVYKPVGTATHYHTDWVVPAWSAKLDKIRAEGTHLFFRWAGWWGTPAAFRNPWVGSEPQVSALAAMSPAHAQTLGGELALDLATPSLVEGAADATTYKNPAGDLMIFVVSPRTDSALLAAKALSACGAASYCKIMMWTDRAAAPTSLPISDAQLETLAFSFLRNQSAGYEKALWNCAIFSRSDRKQCMKLRRSVLTTAKDQSSGVSPSLPRKSNPFSDLTPIETESETTGTPTAAAIETPTSTDTRRRPGSVK